MRRKGEIPMKKLYSLVFALSLMVSACNLSRSDSTLAAVHGPQAWIDAPLPNTVYPLGVVQVVAHGSDPSGVASLELSTNGQVLATQPGGSGSLIAATFNWTPSQAGIYTLRVRAQNNSGDWSGFAETSVVIEDQTATPSSTPTPASTPTPTASPTLGIVLSEPRKSTDQFYYHGGGCGPKQDTFEIQALSDQVYSVVLFYRVKSQSSWGSVAMQPKGNGLFRYALPADGIPGLKLPPPSILASPFSQEYQVQYQFVATDAAKKILSRTQVFSDITLSYCGH
jgi:hypothetical protein